MLKLTLSPQLSMTDTECKLGVKAKAARTDHVCGQQSMDTALGLFAGDDDRED